MKKRLLPLILALALPFTLIPSVYAALPDGGVSGAYRPSYAEPFTVIAETGQLIFDGLPEQAEYNYLWFWLLDEKGAKHAENTLSRSAANRTVFSTAGLRNGTYYVQLYTNSERYGTYTSYLWDKDLPLRVAGGVAVFPLAPVYPHNEKIYSSKRTDRAALDYYLKPSQDIQSGDKEIAALAKTIASGVAGDYKKTLAIHDWVAENIWYDMDVLYDRAPFGDQSATGTLTRRHAVCEGYARLTVALLRAAGIPAKFVTGYVLDANGDSVWTEALINGTEENHAWAEAFAGGRWIIIDTTWDSGNTYEFGQNKDNVGLRDRRYFDATLASFSVHHKYSQYTERQIPEPPADDAPSGWALEIVNRAIRYGIIPDSLQGGYRKNTTRAEFCALAVALIETATGKEITERESFTDTSDVNVRKIAGLGIVTGRGGGVFDPNGGISRQEAAVILEKVARRGLGKELPSGEITFKDLGGSYAVDAIKKLRGVSPGIMSGKSADTFDPDGKFTREESISTMDKLWTFYAA
ncbi:MAG: S-layer homology domain-containing protein [Oscillospiraceae bacterium]|nr:S-layer homology domain-containing protein [Oscillospiraceae bacterium]